MCVCVIDKALPQVLYFAYSMSEGSALSGIENCQLEIYIRHMKQLETHRVVLSSVRNRYCACVSPVLHCAAPALVVL